MRFLQEGDKNGAADPPAAAEPQPSTSAGSAALLHQPEGPETSAEEESKADQATPEAGAAGASTAAPVPTAATPSTAAEESLTKPANKKRQVGFVST